MKSKIIISLILYLLILNIHSYSEGINTDISIKPLLYLMQTIQLEITDFKDPDTVRRIEGLTSVKFIRQPILITFNNGVILSEDGYLLSMGVITDEKSLKKEKQTVFDELKYQILKSVRDPDNDQLKWFFMELNNLILTKKTVMIAGDGNKTYDVSLFDQDRKNGFQLFKVQGKNFPSANINKNLHLEIGDNLTAVQFVRPERFSEDSSGITGKLLEGKVTAVRNENFEIQHTIVYENGFEGSPLFDQNGYLAGINNLEWKNQHFSFSKPLDIFLEWLNSSVVKSLFKLNDTEIRMMISGLNFYTQTGEGYDLYLNGQNQGKTPKMIRLEPGWHKVRIENDKEFDEIRIKAEKDKSTGILIPQFKKYAGSFTIDTDLDNAKIFLDQEYQGKSKVTLNHLTAGKHLLVIHSPDHALFYETVELEAEKPLQRHYQLVQGIPLTFQDLTDDTMTLVVSNQVMEYSCSVKDPLNLSDGRWMIGIFKENSLIQRFQADLKNGNAEVQDLKSLSKGRIYFTFLNKKSRVLINEGDITAEITDSYYQLYPGDYDIRILTPGFKEIIKKITIYDDATTELLLFYQPENSVQAAGVSLLVPGILLSFVSVPVFIYSLGVTQSAEYLTAANTYSFDQFVVYKTQYIATFWVGFSLVMVTAGLLTSGIVILSVDYYKNKKIRTNVNAGLESDGSFSIMTGIRF